MSYKTDTETAFAIAVSSKTHRDAVAEIIRRGLADNPADADALIYEGEENSN